MESDGWLEDLQRSICDPGGRIEPVRTPHGFGGSLRPYQAKGVSWLEYLHRFGLGACLADDMGLGKTIELIAFLLHEREGKEIDGLSPTLLICPMSIASNWKRELERFAPSLKVMVHHGSDRLSGSLFEEELKDLDVVVTTYSLAQRDIETECSCPDWSNPCRHIAAVYYIIAEQFDLDPFLIFKLRGRTKEEVIEALRDRRASGVTNDAVMTACGLACASNGDVRQLEECLDGYWRTGGRLDTLELNPTRPDVESAVLKRLGESPFSIGKANMASLLSKAYGIASRAALKKAAGVVEESGRQ